MMDAVATHEVTVFMTSAQVGKTEILNNAVGYFIDQDPSPILSVQPTLDMARAWSKDRLNPMLRDTPRLKGRVHGARGKDGDSSVLHKSFQGGHITMAGANSAASLAARPIRILLADEVDRWPLSAGTGDKAEGDPLRLARKRTNNFWNRRIIIASTPTNKGFSRIETEWELSDKRFFMVPCPHCHHEQRLEWRNVRWPEDQPRKAALHCEECGVEWSEADRLGAIRHGHWEATTVGNGRTAGFHLSELYSPWSSPANMAQEFFDAKSDPEKLRVWTNTALGELWEQDSEKADPASLYNRLEDWGAPGAPERAMVITCGIDVQDTRIEVERVAWGLGEESWSLEHKIIYGDPSAPAIWQELDDYLTTPTRRADGKVLPVHATAIDSGGHYTQEVYKFANARRARRVWAIKGASGPGRVVWPKRAGKQAKAGGLVFIIGTDAAKDIIYARLKVLQPGPGFSHFPKSRDRVYFDQLTAEIVTVRKVKGFPVRVYELPGGRRNEALDCRVYAYAALQSLNVNWGRVQASEDKDKELQAGAPDPEAEEAATPQEAVEVLEPTKAQEPQRHKRPLHRQRPRRGFLYPGGRNTR